MTLDALNFFSNLNTLDMKIAEEMERIYMESTPNPCFREDRIKVMEKVLEHLVASEVPTVDGLLELCSHTTGHALEQLKAVRLACMAPLVAKIAALEGKLEKWMPNICAKCGGSMGKGNVCLCEVAKTIISMDRDELEQALSTPAPQVTEIPKEFHESIRDVAQGNVSDIFTTNGGVNVQVVPQHHQPPAGLVLHNPDNLTPEHVGPKYRLLCTVELDGRHENIAELYIPGRVEWNSCKANRADCTYRVPISTPWPEIPNDPIIVKPPANLKAPPAIVAQMAAMSAHEKASEQVNYLVADNLSAAGHPALSHVGGKKPQPSTFEAHGKVWTKHVPGDPCPVDGNVRVECLLRDSSRSCGRALGWHWTTRPDEMRQVVGWRYAPQPEQDKPADLTALEKINEQLRADSLKHIETIGGQAEEIARLKEACDDLQNKVHNQQQLLQSRDDWKCRHDSIKRQADEAVEQRDSKIAALRHQVDDTMATFEEVSNKLTAAESRLAALRPRPFGVAAVLMSRPTETGAQFSGTLCWREGITNQDEMRGIAASKALTSKPGFSIDQILVDIIPADLEQARAGKEGK